MTSPVIMLEFNELSPVLMDRFIATGRLPGFAALRRQSLVYTSAAQAEPPYLEPWIQWVTVHTGLPYEAHRVFDLNDGPNCTAPRIWDHLSSAGLSSWVCGSMNIGAQVRDESQLILPDPWATGIEPNPPGLFDSYYHFVSRFVQEHASSKSPVSPADTLAFARFMLSNGLSASTVTQAIHQLMRERGGDNYWRRAVILDRLQWDVFRCFYRRRRPDFSTFFLNSTAHFQHYHWREMEPELFTVAPDMARQESYAQAILFGYERMDRLVSECLQMAPEATIVLCTALSQQALTAYDADGGKQVFKVKDVKRLLEVAGVAPGWVQAPVMAEEFKLHFPSATDAVRAESALMTLEGSWKGPLMRVRRAGDTLFLGCALTRPADRDACFTRTDAPGAYAFADFFFPLEGLKSGAHHPDGILWWRTPGRVHREIAQKASLEAIAPTVLHSFGLVSPGLHAPLPDVSSALKLDRLVLQAA